MRQIQITQTKYDTFPHLDRRHIFTKYGETFVGLLKNYTNCQNVKFNLAFMSETRKTTKHTHYFTSSFRAKQGVSLVVVSMEGHIHKY